jgi:acetyl-CoA carboxylase carboxyl transferase subunit alpha
VAAESRGQGPVIAKNLHAMMQLETPIFSAILAEGGSGGALGIAVADYVVMMQYAIYVICPPARLAEILWRDAGMKETAADAMRLTARELKDLGVIDDVVPEPPGGAHRDPRAAANNLGEEIERFLHGCKTGQWSKQKRYEKFRKIGVFAEAG